MSKKITKKAESSKSKTKSAEKAVTTSPVRYSALPKLPSIVRKPLEITTDRIAFRAFEIFQSGSGTDELGNWLRAESELKTAA
jgi:hypothetical protein